MEIIKNNSSFRNDEIIQMARRENNKKRSFLIVNPAQAKHMPVSPLKTLKLFKELSNELKKHIDEDENILFIGFAETATAIGAGVASHFDNADYLQTTRENIENAEKIVEFKELHSHAVQQTLQSDKWNELISHKQHIIFVEDEISTGTTIMNFVKALKDGNKVPDGIKFSVCSVINGMTGSRKAELLSEGVEFIYLMKISMENHHDIAIDSPAYTHKDDTIIKNTDYLNISGGINSRIGVKMDDYKKSLEHLGNAIIKRAGNLEGKKVAVIGTEECMYPAIFTGSMIETTCNCENVFTHSTTRSPIEPHNIEGYPLKSRESLESFYEQERTTYIYNTHMDYDLTIVITDSSLKNEKAEETLINAFSLCKNFMIVRWNV